MSLDAPSRSRVRGAKFRFAIAAACFNPALVDGLLERVVRGLRAVGVKPTAIAVVRVPGSHEVPWAVAQLAQSRRYDAIIALGVLIGGDTNHHEMVGQSVSQALQHVAIDSGVPAINGVVVTDTLAQAKARCTGRIDRGAEFAHAALEMAELKRKLGRKS